MIQLISYRSTFPSEKDPRQDEKTWLLKDVYRFEQKEMTGKLRNHRELAERSQLFVPFPFACSFTRLVLSF